MTKRLHSFLAILLIIAGLGLSVRIVQSTIEFIEGMTELSELRPERALWMGASLEMSHQRLLNRVLEYKHESTPENFQKLT